MAVHQLVERRDELVDALEAVAGGAEPWPELLLLAGLPSSGVVAGRGLNTGVGELHLDSSGEGAAAAAPPQRLGRQAWPKGRRVRPSSTTPRHEVPSPSAAASFQGMVALQHEKDTAQREKQQARAQTRRRPQTTAGAGAVAVAGMLFFTWCSMLCKVSC